MVEFRFSDFFYPHHLVRTYFLLRQSEQWDAARFQIFQAKALVRLMRLCAMESPFYRQLLPQLGIRWDDIHAGNVFELLSLIPVLDKEVLRADSALFLTDCAHCYRPRLIQTSGTTGTPLSIYWDRGSNIMELCCMQRVWRWAGIRPGQCVLDLRSRIMPENHRSLMNEGGATFLRNWKINAIEFNADLINARNVGEYYRILLRFRPRLVRGHPQAIQHLALLLEDAGLRQWRPKAVTTASEALYDFQRRDIAALWNAPILDTYGLKEHNVFVAQCRAGSYHLFPEYGICEILDDSGKPVEAGEEGWIVATGLHNCAQPLLRYNTRDRAVAGDGGICPCGRTLPVISRLVGRIDDCLYGWDGRRFSGLSFAFFGLRGLRKARIVQESIGHATVELVTTTDFNEGETRRLLAALSKKVDGQVAFQFRLVEEITLSDGGKFKFVVSNVKDSVARV